MSPPQATSIRRRLLIFLLPPLSLLLIAVAYVDYRAAAIFLHASNDGRLTTTARMLFASTWFVDFIQLDLTLLIVWIGVHFGLKPLVAVRRQIESRSARELRPLETSSVPTEVRPLVDAINFLFEMLNGAARNQRQFVADTAHQLRNPIAGLLGSLEVLMREPAAEPIHGRLASLHEGVQRLSHSANQLLVLARADPSINQAVGFETTDLKAIVDRVVERNLDRAVESGLDLGVESSPASATGNDRLLDDLLSNLLDNALKYTPRGGSVTVRCGYENDTPYLEVEDDGPGIPESERPRVLARFYRIPGSAAGGCGLGLAIVDEIARLHHASLSIETGSSGRGAGMKVSFPPAA
jgi:two-component system sensor histidine kinase TctE